MPDLNQEINSKWLNLRHCTLVQPKTILFRKSRNRSLKIEKILFYSTSISVSYHEAKYCCKVKKNAKFFKKDKKDRNANSIDYSALKLRMVR